MAAGLPSWNVPELVCRKAGPDEVGPHDTVQETSELAVGGAKG